MAPMAIATPRPATAPSAALRGPIVTPALFAASRQSRVIPIQPPKSIGAADRSAALVSQSLERAYFRLVIAVRSAESLTIPAAPHQFELFPNGLFPLTVVVPTCALKAPVTTLQS